MKYILAVIAALAAVTILAADNKPSGDSSHIQGRWDIVSCLDAGTPQPVPGLQVVITADKFSFQMNKEQTVAFKYVLDETKKPKTIDTSHEVDPGRPLTQFGIYSLEGDTLKLCLESAGRPRPTKLQATDRDTAVSWVFKRAKP